MFAIRLQRCRGETLLAACDIELLDRELREGKMRLKVSPRFYHGEEADAETLRERLRSASIVNLVGERCIQEAIAAGLECRETLTIEGVPHAQIVRL